LLRLSLDLRTLTASDAPVGPGAQEDAVRVSGVRFRRATSRDLAAVATEPDVPAATQALLMRLAVDGLPGGAPNADEVEAIEAALELADPLAHVTLAVRCDHCGHSWRATLDIAASLWDGLAAQALHTVQQVHLLASAYGWSERDILAMPAPRRALYLRQVAP
jgi:hypothetical protein